MSNTKIEVDLTVPILVGGAVISYINMSEGIDLVPRAVGAMGVGTCATVGASVGLFVGGVSGDGLGALTGSENAMSGLAIAGAFAGVAAGAYFGGTFTHEKIEDYLLDRTEKNKTEEVAQTTSQGLYDKDAVMPQNDKTVYYATKHDFAPA